MSQRVEIQGDHLEGGGQMLRSSLALSAATGRPFVIHNIRRGRSRPGLKAQHLAAVRLAAELCGARVEGADLGSTRLTFHPGRLRAGSFRVDVGTAGSTTLLCQAVLLPALLAPGPVELTLQGGTDVAWSPPADYLIEVLLPYYARLGEVRGTVESRGFYPKGGGRLRLHVNSAFEGWSPSEVRASTPPLILDEPPRTYRARVHSIAHVGLRERRVAQRQAQGPGDLLRSHPLVSDVTEHIDYVRSRSVGSALVARVEAAGGGWPVIIAADGLGAKGLPAETVGARVASLLAARLEHPAPVEEHLADNLIPLLALATGRLRCQQVSLHTLSNLYVVEQFTGIPLQRQEDLLVVQGC